MDGLNRRDFIKLSGLTAGGRNSVFVETGNGDSFVFDPGSGVSAKYNAMGIPPSRMEKVFLTHLHGDTRSRSLQTCWSSMSPRAISGSAGLSSMNLPGMPSRRCRQGWRRRFIRRRPHSSTRLFCWITVSRKRFTTIRRNKSARPMLLFKTTCFLRLSKV